jgi:hypothetical protein
VPQGNKRCRETVTSVADVYCARIEYPKMAGASHAKSRVLGGCGSEACESSRVAYLLKSSPTATRARFHHWKNIMTETFRQSLNKQLTRVIAINLTCLVVFIGFCTLMTFGLLHGAAPVIRFMIAIASILCAIEITVSRLGFWQR